MRKFERLPKAVQMGVLQGVKRGLLLTEDRVRRNTRIKSRRGAAGLMGRLTSNAETKPFMGVEGVIGFRRTRGFPYELAQEFGAKAKPGKAMAIPVSTRAKKAAGPRSMSDLVLVKKGKQAMLIEEGKRGAVKVHYILVKRIKPRLRFMASVTANMNVISTQIERGAESKVQDV